MIYFGAVSPHHMTSGFLRKHRKEIPLDSEIEELVYALLDTAVVATTYSCEGHFTLAHSGAFCHHNQKAQVHFLVKDLPRAASLFDEVLRNVLVNALEVGVRQIPLTNGGNEEVEVQWVLEYHPVNFWEIRPQDEGVFIGVNAKWSEKKARSLLRKAFKATIRICKKGTWREQK